MKRMITGILTAALLCSLAACGKAPASAVSASAEMPKEQTATGFVIQNEKGTFVVETGLAALTFAVKDGEVPPDAVQDARVEIQYFESTKTADAKLISIRVLPEESGKVQPMNPGPVVTQSVSGTVKDATMSTVTIDADGTELLFVFADNAPEINCPVRVGMQIVITYEGEIDANGNTGACTVVRIDAADDAASTSAVSASAASSKAK
ncbi:MAG: hypothetical protein RR867_01570 [Ruthenibacterium sp.]